MIASRATKKATMASALTGLPLLDDLDRAPAGPSWSARSMFTIETTEAGSCSSTTDCTISTIRVSGIFPSRKAMTATSFAAFITAGNVSPSPPTR